MSTISFYTIKNITNLHVGSGESNFGVIDNLIQRDVNTNLPTIHSSSLKGALKEFFGAYNAEIISPVFGDENTTGTWKFLSADLVSRPVRSDQTAYLNATSQEVVKQLAQKLKQFGIEESWLKSLEKLAEYSAEKGNPLVFDSSLNKAVIEELDWEAKSVDFDATDYKNCQKILGSIQNKMH